MERLAAPSEAAALAHDLANTIRATVWRGEGRARDALEALDGVRGEVPLELISLRYYSEEHARYLRAELLQKLDRDAEARRWFIAGFVDTPNELAFLAPVTLHRAQLAERGRDTVEAVDAYALFLRLWAGCDPELRPTVDEARRHLTALGRP